MPVLCSLVSLTVVLGVAFAAYAGLGGLAVQLLPRGRMRAWLVLLVGFPVLVVGTYLYLNRSAAVYHDVFGEWPTPDVAIRESHSFFLGDGGKIRLVFTASPTTVSRIRGRVPSDTTKTWPLPNPKFGFASEEEKLTYDPRTRLAIYTFSGVD